MKKSGMEDGVVIDGGKRRGRRKIKWQTHREIDVLCSELHVRSMPWRGSSSLELEPWLQRRHRRDPARARGDLLPTAGGVTRITGAGLARPSSGCNDPVETVNRSQSTWSLCVKLACVCVWVCACVCVRVRVRAFLRSFSMVVRWSDARANRACPYNEALKGKSKLTEDRAIDEAQPPRSTFSVSSVQPARLS